MGDPDFIISDSSTSVNEVYRQFYGNDGFTINANGGQVFIEINFNEAVDYGSNGLLEINDSIRFVKEYPENLGIVGISYLINRVESRFSDGRFTQTLNGSINTFPDVVTANQSSQRTDSRQTEVEDFAPFEVTEDRPPPTPGSPTGVLTDVDFDPFGSAITEDRPPPETAPQVPYTGRETAIVPTPLGTEGEGGRGLAQVLDANDPRNPKNKPLGQTQPLDTPFP